MVGAEVVVAVGQQRAALVGQVVVPTMILVQQVVLQPKHLQLVL